MLLKFWGYITQMPNLPASISHQLLRRHGTTPGGGTSRLPLEALEPKAGSGRLEEVQTLNNINRVGPRGPLHCALRRATSFRDLNNVVKVGPSGPKRNTGMGRWL